ncbi:AAA family ATPase [Elizabethkingia bruuniana]|uniref:AAA family ATPase n=1 Tax=Elizabethkingia bruuniana TaxID=1756149 RepID=A0A7T7UW96_9FLAO|nr:AAA family ATPase [Elizabethkingia bruuniana]KGO08689.1 ATPase [Elizabethkingia miricola]QQN57361.1 AAA family ATPase [Elizabethkingia bruuniana]
MEESKLFVITGGPGVGKTTLIKVLEKQGFVVIMEEARRIIQEQLQMKGEGLPWKNKTYYAQLMLNASLESYQLVVSGKSSNTTFFDRGILDTICYMKMENIPVPEDLNNLVNAHPYNQKVFILPPWEEIYSTDNERKQTWQEAVSTFDKMKQTYLEYGYKVIEVPKNSVEQRCEFILSHI